MAPEIQQLVCIVGCGRWLRRDDEAGLRIVKAMSEGIPLPRTEFHLTEAPATDIPIWLDGVGLLVLIDAAKAAQGHPPGSYERIDYRKGLRHIHQRVVSDTHGLSVDLALSVSDVLGILPKEVWIYAVAAEDFTSGEGLSPRVGDAVLAMRDVIPHDVRDWLKQSELCHA